MSASLKSRVLLVDDHPLMRAGVAAALAATDHFDVVGQAGDPATARESVARLKPDLVLLDLVLGDADGLALIRELRQWHPPAKIIVLSMLNRAEFEHRALAAGAVAYFEKSVNLDHLGPALQAVLSATSSLADMATLPRSQVALLSDRELQVFTLIGRGRSTAEIAEALGVSPRTIDAHKEHIKQRLGLAHAAELSARAAQWVTRQGLTGPVE